MIMIDCHHQRMVQESFLYFMAMTQKIYHMKVVKKKGRPRNSKKNSRTNVAIESIYSIVNRGWVSIQAYLGAVYLTRKTSQYMEYTSLIRRMFLLLPMFTSRRMVRRRSYITIITLDLESVFGDPLL